MFVSHFISLIDCLDIGLEKKFRLLIWYLLGYNKWSQKEDGMQKKSY
jgi:hypothetical protein